jgi:hypothetical protein
VINSRFEMMVRVSEWLMRWTLLHFLEWAEADFRLASGEFVEQLVGFGCHYEVVAVQSADSIGGPRDRELAPFDGEAGVVAFLLRGIKDQVSQLHGLLEIAKGELTFQSVRGFGGEDDPFGDFG